MVFFQDPCSFVHSVAQLLFTNNRLVNYNCLGFVTGVLESKGLRKLTKIKVLSLYDINSLRDFLDSFMYMHEFIDSLNIS